MLPALGEAPLDGFQRLLVHSLANYYGLTSSSAVGGDGARSTTVRWRAGEAGSEAGRTLEPCCTFLDARFAVAA